ncbi:hypothetical protein ACFLQU_00770 [Verrucomicrobiota bacterium]
MKTSRIISIALCICVLLSPFCSGEGENDLQTQLSKHKARDLASWQHIRQKSFADRVLPAPELLLDYLRLDNKLNGYAGVPRAPKDWQPFAGDVRAVLTELPAPVQKHLQSHVLGIFLVRDLGSTAYTELVAHFQKHRTGFIVLDVSALDRSANAWATWRENTPFKESPDIQLSVRIADDKQDSRRYAISFILLHELGHLVGTASRAHAPWWTGGNPSAYPFSALSWTLRRGNVVPRRSDGSRDRYKVRFYATEGSHLPAKSIPAIYGRLPKTNFVSLYASTSVYEDFAETYAMYVHVVMQKRPWALTLQREGRTLVELFKPILEARCRTKRQYIARLMAAEPQQDKSSAQR